MSAMIHSMWMLNLSEAMGSQFGLVDFESRRSRTMICQDVVMAPSLRSIRVVKGEQFSMMFFPGA